MNIDLTNLGTFSVNVHHGYITVVDYHENEIYRKFMDGWEWWKEYNSECQLIHFKNSDVYECWKTYNSDGTHQTQFKILNTHIKII